MESFNSPPLVTPLTNRNWQDAPKIVKGWAYPLTWLAIFLFALFLVAVVVSNTISINEKFGLGILYAALLTVHIWLNRALKKGLQAAWTVQIALSALGLLGVPLGTLIHGYILSQWFKPENKVWFDLN